MPSEFRRPPVPPTPEFHRRLEDDLRRAARAGAKHRILTPGWWRLLHRLRPALHGATVLCMAATVLLLANNQGQSTTAYQQGPVLAIDQLDRAPTWFDPTPGSVFRTAAATPSRPRQQPDVPPLLEVR